MPIELELRVRVDEPVAPLVKVTLPEDKLAVSPDGEARVIVTVPEKLFRLARSTLDVPLVPTRSVTEDVLVAMLKSDTFTVMFVE